MTKEEIQQIFKVYGQIEHVYMDKDIFSGRPKGSCSVIFTRKEDADDAIASLHKTKIGGYSRTVRVEHFQPVHEERNTSQKFTDRELRGEKYSALGQTTAQKSKQMQLRMQQVENTLVHRQQVTREAVRSMKKFSNNPSVHADTTKTSNISGSIDSGNIFSNISIYSAIQQHQTQSSGTSSNILRTDPIGQTSSNEGAGQSVSSGQERKFNPAYGKQNFYFNVL